MGIDQKVRSLHCGLQQGMGFEVIAEERIVLLRKVPFELEDIVARWIAALPVKLVRGPTAIVRLYPTEGLALTESGWSAFVSWMTETLRDAQHEPSFTQKAQQSAKNATE